MAQSVERRIGSAEVTGPIPVTSFIVEKSYTLECKAFLCKDCSIWRLGE